MDAPIKAQPSQHQSDDLYKACGAWLQAALLYLQRQPYIPGYEDIKVTFNPDGKGLSTETIATKIEPSQVLRVYRGQLFSMPELNTVLEVIANSTEITSVLFARKEEQTPLDREQLKRLVEGYLGIFLIEYIKTRQSLAFDTASYDLIYGRFEDYLFSTEPITTITQITIKNLRCEAERVDLANNVYLRQATYEERKEAVRRELAVFSHRYDVPETMLCIVYQVAPREKLSIEQQREVHDIANAVIYAMRLLKPEDVEQEAIYWNLTDQPFRDRDGVASSLIHKDFFTDLYILNASDTDELKKLWLKARKAYPKQELATGRTRYEGAYLRRSLEDMLIDYWIGLESLFLPEDQAHEMAQAVGLAVSHYLGLTVNDRKRIYREIMESHGLRGQVIHGKPVNGTKLREMTKKTGELLRRSLRKRVEE